MRSRDIFAVTLVACLASACADEPQARGPNQSHPVDEPRAQEVIARTFEAEGVEIEANRTVSVGATQKVKVEVAAAGHKIGVAYLTREEVKALEGLLPKHENDEGALVILSGAGPDDGAHILALWETDYMQDDLSGASHSATEIAAEQRLARDVRDFLQKAKAEQWP